jgi:hypothetical protein
MREMREIVIYNYMNSMYPAGYGHGYGGLNLDPSEIFLKPAWEARTGRCVGLHRSVRILQGRKTRYRHGVPTHDNKNPMFCVIAYSPFKKLSLGDRNENQLERRQSASRQRFALIFGTLFIQSLDVGLISATPYPVRRCSCTGAE